MKDRTFVMQQTTRVNASNVCSTCIVMFAITRLVTEAPHNDARVIAITFNHACHSRQPSCGISRVVTQACVETMTFDIRFINDIQAVFITEVVETMVIRIMRRANCIDIGALHRDDVLAHIFNRYCFAFVGMVIVTIHAHDGDGPTIHTD